MQAPCLPFEDPGHQQITPTLIDSSFSIALSYLKAHFSTSFLTLISRPTVNGQLVLEQTTK